MVTLDNVIERLKYDKEIDMDINELAPQIAECLEELKAYREIGTVEECKNSVLNIQKAYNKALDDFAETCEGCQFTMYGQGYLYTSDIKDIAELLKRHAPHAEKRGEEQSGRDDERQRNEEYAKNFAYDAHAIAAEMEGGSLLDCEEAQDAGVGSACAAVEQAEYEMDMER